MTTPSPNTTTSNLVRLHSIQVLVPMPLQDTNSFIRVLETELKITVSCEIHLALSYAGIKLGTNSFNNLGCVINLEFYNYLKSLVRSN